MVAAARERAGIQTQSDFVSEVALRRSGKSEEVANLVAFLLGDESSYISGATHSIDGGWFC
jgi:NAD(P)-dependent dehydrogenase (short-subunit alcohol dehydrogenase family)